MTKYTYEQFRICRERHISFLRQAERCGRVAEQLGMKFPADVRGDYPIMSTRRELMPCTDQQDAISSIFSLEASKNEESISGSKGGELDNVRNYLLKDTKNSCWSHVIDRIPNSRKDHRLAAKTCRIAGVRAVHDMYRCLRKKGR